MKLKPAPSGRAQDEDGEIEVLSDRVPLGEASEWRIYNPLTAADALFKEFALRTAPTRDGILEFANQYGCLGGAAARRVLLPKGAVSVLGSGELKQAWRAEIAEMRRLVTLWELAKAKDVERLAEYIHWRSGTAVLYECRSKHVPNLEWIASPTIHPERLTKFRSGDVVTPACWYLQGAINAKLVEHEVTTRLLWDARCTALSLRIVPNTLLACLWLQFAKAIEGEKGYRQCPNCQKWFEVGGSRGARADKKFCTPTCKAAAHRKQAMK